MSSMVEFASSSSSSQENRDSDAAGERVDSADPAAALEFSLTEVSLLAAAISLKDQVVKLTWPAGREVGPGVDPTVYTGLLGTAFTCLRSYEATGDRSDLVVCADIIDTCTPVARASSRHVTFLCGKSGVYALGAVVADIMGDHQRRDFYLNLFLELAQERALPAGPEEGGFGMSYDLLYGRSGFLYAALFINKHIGPHTIPLDLLSPVVDAVLAGGRAGASAMSSCPLMYRWHGTCYWGAANGLAGILQVLLHFALSEEGAENVKGTLRYMMSKRFPRSGNYPSSEGNPRDKLVQWSHGATGMAVTLCKASEVFPRDREFRDAAIEAGEVVWKNGLVKKAGLADGVAGNAYAFLSLYRLTGETVYRDRAKAFASCLFRDAATDGPIGSCSLFQGLAGAACLSFDLLHPESSRFPGYEI